MTPPIDIDALAAQLTTDEKVWLLGGRDFWHTEPIERLGIPALHLSDGPSGVRGERSVGTTSVSFPCGSAIGATFDVEAAAKLAEALADECAERGVHVLLGPTVNLHRHPLGGRHFECYSEDPYLSAILTKAYVSTLQARRVSATIKHFVANDTEYHRHTISSDVADRVLRELYLVPFESGVSETGAWAVMSAYNKVNGTYAAENTELLQGILRDEWGFDGVVVSDWFGTQSTIPSALAGLDLEMPGPPVHYGKRLAEAVTAGEVSEDVLDTHVRRLLLLAQRTGALDASKETDQRTTPDERRAVSRQLAADAMVLLRNEAVGAGSQDPAAGHGPVLPLDLGPGSVLAVIGPNAADTAGQGGGSARVNAVHTVSVLEGLRRRLEPLGVEVAYERGCVTWAQTPALNVALELEYFTGSDESAFAGETLHREPAGSAQLTWLGEPVPGVNGLEPGGYSVRCSGTLEPTEDGTWTFALVQVGSARLSVGGETVVEVGAGAERGKGFFGFGTAEQSGSIDLSAGRSYDIVVDYTVQPRSPLAGLFVGAIPPLPEADELLRRAEALATRADAVVCVVGTNGEWETEGHDRVSMDLPGLQDDLVRRLIAANPRTAVLVNAGSPVTMDWADDAAAVAQIWFAGEQVGEAVAAVLLGDTDPGGRLPTTIPIRLEDTPAFPFYPGTDGHAPYGEGLLIGYRHYDTAGVEPRFAFGHGLSYTTFELSDLAVEGTSQATVTVTNTGDRPGTEVVQCYVHGVDGPDQQLRAVRKVRLGPGESATVRLELGDRAFARYDEGTHDWVVDPGTYEVRVGRSSRDLPLRAEVSPGA